AHCVQPELFGTCLAWLEEDLGRMTFESIAIVAYAAAHAGLDRPSLWAAIVRQMTESGSEWSVRAIGRVVGATRKLLMIGVQGGHEEHSSSLVALFRVAGREMLKRGNEITFHE
ncbi:unnamed protein product, partial [Polarella glacialis]